MADEIKDKYKDSINFYKINTSRSLDEIKKDINKILQEGK